MKMIAALIALVVIPLAQDKQDKSDKGKKEPAPPITLSGCVARADGTPTQYTLIDETGTSMYRLSGMNVRGYVGKRVELVGAEPDSKKVQIKIGLLPNATVAGQRGSMDPAQAATAAAGGSAPVGDVQLPEFRVRSVKPLDGGCEKR
ncbi:MAG TPA: hypothetical protein VKH42_15030 [Vicinamibacterales bacterium]|nr:hypothetical protein [Vicinamibacterales bacterium]